MTTTPPTLGELHQQLKLLLNLPLPGGRGFQRQRDREIKSLCRQIADRAD